MRLYGCDHIERAIPERQGGHGTLRDLDSPGLPSSPSESMKHLRVLAIKYEAGAPNHVPQSESLEHRSRTSVGWLSNGRTVASVSTIIRFVRLVTILLPFLLGSFGSAFAATAPFSPEEDLATLMRHIKMPRAIIVGNSSGAGLALDFALAHPDMVEELFLIGPVVHGMPSSAYFLDRGNRANAPLAKNDVKAAAENWSRDPYLISGADPDARKKIFDALTGSPQNLKNGGAIRDASDAADRSSALAD
jgi:pimeloyl-ACP methyl ester carboxylesterase